MWNIFQEWSGGCPYSTYCTFTDIRVLTVKMLWSNLKSNHYTEWFKTLGDTGFNDSWWISFNFTGDCIRHFTILLFFVLFIYFNDIPSTVYIQYGVMWGGLHSCFNLVIRLKCTRLLLYQLNTVVKYSRDLELVLMNSWLLCTHTLNTAEVGRM